MDSDRLAEQMTELAQSFPCLHHAWGVDPFEALELNRWATSGLSHGERMTASFILTVWDPSTEWEAGRFDVMEALRLWDLDHRAPFLKWAMNPWWP